ncbi:MAG TPA: hypothetical protein VFJ75_07210 [Gaiellaceae bacterium]|nr:hypothetical protein [Gaiellaceae bacterium]
MIRQLSTVCCDAAGHGASVFEPELREQGLWLERTDFRKWDLGDLLRLAADAGWLPKSGVSPDEIDFAQKAKLGDVTPNVKLMRNLVHAGENERVSAQPHPVALIPRCVGCGQLWLPRDTDHRQAHWRSTCWDDLLFYCSACAKRESE